MILHSCHHMVLLHPIHGEQLSPWSFADQSLSDSVPGKHGLCFGPTLMFLAAATSHPRLKCISWKLSFLIFLFFNFISARGRGAFACEQAALNGTAFNWQCLACCVNVCVCVICSEWIMLTFWIFDQDDTCSVLTGDLVLFALHQACK